MALVETKAQPALTTRRIRHYWVACVCGLIWLEGGAAQARQDAPQQTTGPQITRMPRVQPDGTELPAEGAVVPDGLSVALNTSFTYVGSETSGDGSPSDHRQFLLGFEPVLRTERWGGWVLRSEGRFAWVHENDPAVGQSFPRETVTFQQGETTLTHDFYSHALRLQFGDVQIRPQNFQNSTRVLGFSLARNYERIHPARNIRPTGTYSFQVERPSRVNVYAAGALVGQEFVDPGAFDINSFGSGFDTQDIELEIIDDRGRVGNVSFAELTAIPLLRGGTLDFGLNAGLMARARLDGIDYLSDQPVLSAYAIIAPTDRVNLGADFQADRGGVMAGLSQISAFRSGNLQLRAALSRDRAGKTGLATGIAFSSPFVADEWRFSARWQYRDDNFRGASESIDLSTPLLRYRQPEHEFNASLGRQVGQRMYLSLGGDWRRLRSGAFDPASPAYTERWSTFVAVDYRLSKQYSMRLHANLTDAAADRNGEVSLFLRLRRAFGATYSGDIAHDTRRNRSTATLSRTPGFEINQVIGRAQASVTDGDPSRYALSGDLDYEGNRFSAFAYHTEDHSEGGGEFSRDSFVQAESALVFADGVVAIGRPVRSGGFAIVRPFEDRPMDPVFIDDWGGQEYRARSGWFGPAVVNPITPYGNRALDISVREKDQDVGENTTSELSIERLWLYLYPQSGVLLTPNTEESEESGH